ncbi:MAG: O-antigen ligase family protein [Candidatus Moraniibacteriota bacterium]|nr:MAG: O-antigen ligase family protein [Candidatus Moranbacteria bacterium]
MGNGCYAGAMLKSARQLSWYAFVFLLPWQTVWIVHEVFVRGEKWQYATIGLYLSDAALLTCAAFFVFGAKRGVWRTLARDRLFIAISTLFLWSLLSALWAVDESLAFLSAWRVLLLVLAFVLARYGGFSIRKTISVFLLSMSIQALLALSQWVGQFVALSTLLGMAEHDPSRWGTFVLKTENGRFLRAYGGFEHPNVLGGALAVAALFGGWFSVTAKKVSFRAASLGATALLSFVLVLTFSRSGWMGFFFGTGVLFFGFIRCLKCSLFLSFPRRRESTLYQDSDVPRENFSETRLSTVDIADNFPRKSCFNSSGVLWYLDSRLRGNDGRGWVSSVVIVVLLTFISYSVAFFLVRDIALSRFSEATLVREGSLSDREIFLDQAFRTIREHPILGVGGGNFTAFSMWRFPDVGDFVGAFQPVHVVPILVCAELGLVGFLLFSRILLIWLFSAWKSRNALSLAVFCALLPVLFLDHWLWSGHFGVIFLGFLLGVCVRANADAELEIIPSARSRSFQ